MFTLSKQPCERNLCERTSGFCGDFTKLFNEFTILRNIGFLKAWHRQTHIAFCKLGETQFGSTKKTSAQRREGNQRYSKLLAGFA